MKALYLIVNLAVISVPLIFSWHPKLRFVDTWRAFVPACVIVLVGFVAWDALFTHWGVWGFDDRYVLGYRVLGLPVEEWLFFLCIPYACVFTYHALPAFCSDSIARFFSAAVLLMTVVVVALYPDRPYTAVTGTLTGLFLAGVLWKKPTWIGRLWGAYLVLLVPFVLSNGVLTGITFWEYPLLNQVPDAITNHIVWYDNGANLGIRLFSVPLDDFLYAFLLIGLNVALFERFRGRRATTASAG